MRAYSTVTADLKDSRDWLLAMPGRWSSSGVLPEVRKFTATVNNLITALSLIIAPPPFEIKINM